MGGVPYLSVVIIPGDESLLVTVDNSPPFKQFQGCFLQAANISPFVRLTFRDVWRETPPSRRHGLCDGTICRKAIESIAAFL